MKKNLALIVLFTVVLVLLGSWLIGQFFGSMMWPVSGEITSPYGNRTHPVTGEKGKFHNGVDLNAKTGTPVKAVGTGVVQKRYTDAIGGNSLVIKHDNGYSSGYAHLSSFQVAIGDRVKKGQVIAKSGATGRVTGAHLHLTMRDPKGEYVNPESVIR